MSEVNAVTREPQRYPKMSNDLLRAAHQSGLQEMKVIFLAASKLPQDIDSNFDPLTPIYISRDDAVKIGFNPKNVARDLRNACSSLRARQVTIPTEVGDKVTSWVYNLLFFKTDVFQHLKDKYPDGEGDEEFLNHLRAHNLLEALPFLKKSDANLMVRIVMHPDILQFLVQLKENYTQYDLLELAKLTDSIYSFRIFLMMMQWKGTGVVHKKIDDLRREFKLVNKYENAKDLRKWVIDAAVNEINEKTDWQLSYTLKKTGRKFTHVEFKFKEKKTEKQIKQAKQLSPVRDPDTVDMFTGKTDKEQHKPVSFNALTEQQAKKYAAILKDNTKIHLFFGSLKDADAYYKKVYKTLATPNDVNIQARIAVFGALHSDTDFSST